MRYKSLPLQVRSGGHDRRIEPPTPQVPQRSSRLRNWVATAPVLLLLVGLVIGQVTRATVPELHVQGTAVPDGWITVHGGGFPQPQVQLWWDGDAKAMPAPAVQADGSFMIDMQVPADTALGSHVLAVTAPGAAPGQVKRGNGVLASVTLQVQSALPSPTVTPTPPPSLAPSAPATPALPTPTPTAAPSHSHDPTPAPTASPTPPAGGPDSVACTGYPEPRVFLEVQSWWEGTNTQGSMAHLHAGTCFPLGQTVHGVVRLDTRITMHDNVGHLFALSTDLFTDGHGTGDNVYTKLDRDCSGTCQFWVTTYIDTRGAQDGWHEIRLKPRVRFADGRRQMTSTGWVIRTANGNPSGSSRDSTGAVIGRGWYEDNGYQNPAIRSMAPILDGPVSGSWTVSVRLGPGGQGFASTFSAAYVDPDFHMGSEGWKLLALNASYLGSLTIDTTRLANGSHRLVLRVESEHNGETLDGLLVLPFTVQN